VKNHLENIPHCLSNIIPAHVPILQFTYKAGTFIFKEKESVKGVFYICSGQIQLLKKDKNLQEQKLATAGIDEWMGISAALFEKYYSNSAQALTDVKVCFILLDDFDKMLPENPVLAKQLLQNLTTKLNKLDYMHTV